MTERSAGASRSHAQAPDGADGLGGLGEFELIDRLVGDGQGAGGDVLVGPGDDGAVVRLDGPEVVVSTDALVEGVHFRCDWSAATDIGRKAIAVNVSDIEAMGARPVGVVVALSVPAHTELRWLDDFATGVRAECAAAGVALVGGDTTSAPQVVVTVTAFGDLAGRAAVLRSGARPGDQVAVRGLLGWSAAGLQTLRRGFASPRAAVAAHRVPQVPYGEGAIAARAGATAMIDVSDGLLADLDHVARASAVTFDLRSSAFAVADPVRAVAAATGTDPLRLVLAGGEDYALAATFPPGDLPNGWQAVGSVTVPGPDGPTVLVDSATWDGSTGFDHFGSH